MSYRAWLLRRFFQQNEVIFSVSLKQNKKQEARGGKKRERPIGKFTKQFSLPILQFQNHSFFHDPPSVSTSRACRWLVIVGVSWWWVCIRHPLYLEKQFPATPDPHDSVREALCVCATPGRQSWWTSACAAVSITGLVSHTKGTCGRRWQTATSTIPTQSLLLLVNAVGDGIHKDTQRQGCLQVLHQTPAEASD